ncbi:hypothetical protein K8R03_04445 [Candidatus Kaiserbacteria bacterium]|nr:hypothetical protein [Candidatus Kaiserbacteria bacterium]
MRTTSHIVQFILAAVIVIAVGGLTGWYYFIHHQIANTAASDAARGTNTPSFGGSTGSTFQNSSGSIGTDTTDQNESSSGQKAAPQLWHVTKSPVAGFGFASTTPGLYYAEVSSGNILQADPRTSANDRLTNTLMPKVYEAHFSTDGSAVFRLANGNTLQTFAGVLASTTETIDSTSTPRTLKGLYLAEDIASISVAPSRSLVYALMNPDGGSVIVRSDWTGASQKTLLSSALSGWNIYTPEDGTVVIVQKPADNVAGFAYTLGTSGTLSSYVRNVPGLTVLPRTGGARLYGSAGNTLELYAQVSADAAPVHLPIGTTADKCVWAKGSALVAYCAVPRINPGAGFLSARAQGSRHSADAWYTVDVSSGTAELLYAPDPGLALDVENPTIDSNNAYIAFSNGADKSLWMLRITK